MGDQRGWADCGDSEGDYRGNPSSPNTPHGLVQCQTSNNMEAYIPSNVDECSPGLPATDRSGLGTDGRTVVEIPFRRTRVGRYEQAGLKFHSLDIINSDFV